MQIKTKWILGVVHDGLLVLGLVLEVVTFSFATVCGGEKTTFSSKKK